MFYTSPVKKLNRVTIYVIALMIMLYISRTFIPLSETIFIILTPYILFLIFYQKLNSLIISSKNFIKNFGLSIVLGVILASSFLLTYKLYVEILKDVFNVIILLFLYYVSYLFINTKQELNFFIDTLKILFILTAFILSIKFLSVFFAIKGSIINESGNFIFDINFSILPIIFSIIILLFLQKNKDSRFKTLICFCLQSLYVYVVLLSGSRRGIFVLALVFIFLLTLLILSKTNLSNRIIDERNLKILNSLLSIIIATGFFFSFILSPPNFKTKFFNLVGIEKVNEVNTNFKNVISKYNGIFNSNIQFNQYSDLFFDSKDPNNGWGTRIHKTIFPLNGINSELIPSDAKGYLMDSTCNADTRSGNAYSYTAFLSRSFKKGTYVEATVFCFESIDFDGTWSVLSTEGAFKGDTESFYDQSKKGTWQHLKIKGYCTGGIVNFYLYFSKFGVKDFKTLKGYVIFASPEILINNDHANSNFDASKNKNEIVNLTSLNNQLVYQTSLISISKDINKLYENNPLKNLFDKLFKQDTSYIHYTKDLKLNKENIYFSYDRISRWKFGLLIFFKEYNFPQKLFGNGFSFMNWYGHYFLHDKTASDWPHNPFISVLLYSGFIGFVTYLLLFAKAFILYIKFFANYFLFLILFLITFFFSFFSSGSPFDPPIMGFLTILPFFIHSIYKKEILNNA